jgi:cytochrome oxidase Cu insertion factor (SCO1/SenC/PrrC family)
MSNLIVARRSLMLGAAAVALIPAIAFANGPEVGKPAPLFTAVDSNGKTWSLADLKGKVVVIETTNQDCPYVRKHYTSKNMQTQGRGVADLGLVGRRRARLRHGAAGQPNDPGP